MHQDVSTSFPSELIRRNTKFITNAVYFKGDWDYQFEKKLTKDDDFKVNPGNTIKVPMMFQNEDFRYHETQDLQILEMDYEGNDLSMLVFLPKLWEW